MLLIGHLDTVFDPGTAAERPFRIDDGTAFGPGVTDMKSGLLAGLYALKAIIAERGGLPFERLVFIANPDEEIGSPTRRRTSARSPRDSDVALVLECARANGDIVSARKGILDLRMTVHGRAAHAGVEPEKGRSAILEAARIVDDLHALNGRWPGVTVNVGVIAGGTPAQRRRRALLARGRPARDRARGARDRRGRDPADRGGDRGPGHGRRARAEMARWWPMEKLDRSGRLVEHAQAVAGALGLRGRRRVDRRRVGRQHDVGHGRARASTASDRSVATTMPRPSTSRSTRSCPGRRCWPACSSRSPPTRRSWPGAPSDRADAAGGS